MAGPWQESVIGSATGAASYIDLYYPTNFHAGYLHQITLQRVSGDATIYDLHIYEDRNGAGIGSFYTTQDNQYLIGTIGSTTGTYANYRDKTWYYVAKASYGSGLEDPAGNRKNCGITAHLRWSGGTKVAQTYRLTLGGLGLS